MYGAFHNKDMYEVISIWFFYAEDTAKHTSKAPMEVLRKAGKL